MTFRKSILVLNYSAANDGRPVGTGILAKSKSVKHEVIPGMSGDPIMTGGWSWKEPVDVKLGVIGASTKISEIQG